MDANNRLRLRFFGDYRDNCLTPMNARIFTILTLLASLVLAHAAPEAFEVGPAQKDQLPQGKEADGIIGDFLLRNDRIEAVISGNLTLRRAIPRQATKFRQTGRSSKTGK